ncbi:MAG: hypothetical protein B6D56_00110 [Candidatus Omnitrophica bacterium 4484_70.1]|nr:MAG: hypothetical protein B6D56_00110 [Candidatus Omnitrophica bacterium 4484_70.1]
MDLEKIKNLPDLCGVYVFKGKNGEALYIGKATSLRKRILSHFREAKDFIKKVEDIEYILCATEEQALLLEASLIKEEKPRYNVVLKDDKSYPYVVITQERYPAIYVARPKKTKNLRLFGPYPNVKLLKSALNLIRKIFPFRSCKKLPKKVCLYYHLRLCPGVCEEKIKEEEYQDIVDNIIRVLKGERKILLKKLQRKMEELAKEKKFEEAGFYRDRLEALSKLYAGRSEGNEAIILKEVLHLKRIPFIIEGIDISCTQGREACGSVVVFKDGYPDKSNYRRYRIKKVDEIDDYRMIAEVVERRYRRLEEEKKELPDLVVIDGGKGHLSVVKKILDDLGLQIPVISLAKRREEIWIPSKKEPLRLPSDNLGLQLLQRVRDEAHRFAHRYHQILRKKKIFENDRI